MPTDKIARLRELEAKATIAPWRVMDSGCEGLSLVQTQHVTRDVWHIPRVPEDLKLMAEVRNAIPHLLAIAEAAKELKREDETPVRDLTMIRTRTKQLYEAITAFEEAQ